MSELGFNENANNKKQPPQPPTPEQAKYLAAILHYGQTDHSGCDYILHPERVATNLLRIAPDISNDVICAAWLHDTMEDCRVNGDPVDEEYLQTRGQSADTTTMVRLLTKPENDKRPYDQVIDELIASGNKGAMLIKIADNMDNLHPHRVADLKTSQMEKDNPGKAERLYNRYMESIKKLSNAVGIETHLIEMAIDSAPPLKQKFDLKKEFPRNYYDANHPHR